MAIPLLPPLWVFPYYQLLWLHLMYITLLQLPITILYIYSPTTTPYAYHVRLFPYDHPLWLTIMAIPLLTLSMVIPWLFPYYHHICLSIMAIPLLPPLMPPPYDYSPYNQPIWLSLNYIPHLSAPTANPYGFSLTFSPYG